MKAGKLKLNELHIQSFVTTEENNQVYGGQQTEFTYCGGVLCVVTEPEICRNTFGSCMITQDGAVCEITGARMCKQTVSTCVYTMNPCI